MYTFDKKILLNIYSFVNVVDIKLLYYMKHNAVVETLFPQYSRSRTHITSLYRSARNLNKSIPVLKLQEECEGYARECEKMINECRDSESEQSFSFLNNDKIECLQDIEKEGLQINQEEFDKFFPNNKKHISDSKIHTQYNIYTATGRPSNRFGNINFAALNKDTGERGCFTSRFGSDGVLIMHDFESYHVRLIAEAIGFELPKDISAHEFLAQQYFAKKELTQEEIGRSKEATFQILYGGIDKTVANEIPYFAQVQKFIDALWYQFNTFGYVETIVFKQKFYKENLSDMNSNKLFNFILQNIETERNIVIMRRVQELLRNTKTRLVLYLYDAMLFDTFVPEGQDLIRQIKDIMEETGKYPVRTYFGSTFHGMVKVKI